MVQYDTMQGVFSPPETGGTGGIIPPFFLLQKKFHRFFIPPVLKIPPVFSKISWILRKIPPVLKSSLGFQMTLCFQIKNLSGNFLWF